MNKKILFGTILSVFLMLMIPSVNAVKYNVSTDSIESNIISSIENRNFKNSNLILKIKQALQRIENVDNENYRYLNKISCLLEDIDENIHGNDILLKFALIHFLFGCLWLISGYMESAEVQFMLCIYYLILYVLSTM